jgi:hypothetical protein
VEKPRLVESVTAANIDPDEEEEEDYDPIEYIWLTRSMRT